VATKPKSKSTKPKPKTEEYDRTWMPRPIGPISKIKIKTKSVPLPKVSLREINETKKPRTRQA